MSSGPIASFPAVARGKARNRRRLAPPGEEAACHEVQISHSRRPAFLLAMLLGFFLVSSSPISALELTGAWAASAGQCSKVFTRGGRANEIAFTALSARHGGGFIIEANRVRGKFATCAIKSRKGDAQSLNLIVACATDIMLSNVQFILKMLDDKSVVRQFPGMEGMESKYYRCSI